MIRRRQLIELIERCAAEDRYDFVTDILVRYKNLKRIYAYKLPTYWNNIASVDAYYKTNMDFLKPEVRPTSLKNIRRFIPRWMICPRPSTIRAP